MAGPSDDAEGTTQPPAPPAVVALASLTGVGGQAGPASAGASTAPPLAGMPSSPAGDAVPSSSPALPPDLNQVASLGPDKRDLHPLSQQTATASEGAPAPQIPGAIDAAATTVPATSSPAGPAAVLHPAPTVSAAPAQQPAAQVGHAVATLQVSPTGASQLTVQLAPPELGRVQVRIDRVHDGAAIVSVGAERPETLVSLQADLGHLHQALDRAGVPEQRSLSFHLSTSADSFSATPQGGAGGQGGFQQAPRHHLAQAVPVPAAQTGGQGVDAQSAPATPTASASAPRNGIDITA